MVLESSTSVAASSSGVRAISSRYRPTLSRPSISRSLRVAVRGGHGGHVLPSYRADRCEPVLLSNVAPGPGFPPWIGDRRRSACAPRVDRTCHDPVGSCPQTRLLRHFSGGSPGPAHGQTGSMHRLRASTSTPTSARGSPTTTGLLARGDQRQRRLRLPRRRRGHDARGVRDGGRGAGSWSAPRSPTATARTSAGVRMDVPYDVLAEQVAEQVGRSGRIAAEAGTACRLPEAARRALQPGGRRRGAGRARCWTAPGDLPVLGLPGSALLRLARGGRAPASRRGSPTAATPPTAGWCRATSRARWSRTPDQVAAQAVAPRRRASTRCACTATPRGGRDRRGAVRAALGRGRVRGGRVGLTVLPRRVGDALLVELRRPAEAMALHAEARRARGAGPTTSSRRPAPCCSTGSPTRRRWPTRSARGGSSPAAPWPVTSSSCPRRTTARTWTTSRSAGT